MSGHLLLFSTDITKPTAALTGNGTPAGEIRLGVGVLTYRDVADVDDLIDAALRLRNMLREAQTRDVVVPPAAEPDPLAEYQAASNELHYAEQDVLLDPDCRDGKHTSCVGGPCECACHAPPLPQRKPAGPLGLLLSPPADEADISEEEFEAAKQHLLDTRGSIPDSLQRVIDRGGRFRRVRPSEELSEEELLSEPQPGGTIYPQLTPQALAGGVPLESLAPEQEDEAAEA